MTNNKYKRDLFQTAGNNMLKQSTSKGDFCVGSSDKVFRLFQRRPCFEFPPLAAGGLKGVSLICSRKFKHSPLD